MKSETRRQSVILLAQSVAHLYAIAGATAAADDDNDGADERAAAIGRVLEMLQCAHDQLASMPACAAHVLDQRAIVHSVHGSMLEHAQIAMVLARAGLVINTWCTAATMLVSDRATEGPLTIGSLMHIIGTMQPDGRYQDAWLERVAEVAYDNSALRQLGVCYFQAFEGYSLLELHRLGPQGDTAHAAALFDNASRGALTAVRFLARQPITEATGDSDQDTGEDGTNAASDAPDHGPDAAGTDATGLPGATRPPSAVCNEEAG